MVVLKSDATVDAEKALDSLDSYVDAPTVSEGHGLVDTLLDVSMVELAKVCKVVSIQSGHRTE